MFKSTKWVLLMLLSFWTVVIAAADYIVLSTTARQFLAGKFPTTTGRMVVSHVMHQTILTGGVTFEYSYTVDGKEYRGHHYRYDDQNASFRPEEVVDRFPLWSEQTVYFNPRHPADSLLAPGIEGTDLMLLLFATPVNIATFMIWAWVVAWTREKRRVLEAGGVKIRRTGRGVRVRLAEVSPLAAGLYALGCAAFAATFPVVVTHGFAPAKLQMEMVWMVVWAAALFASLWMAVRNGSGKYDLLIDESAQTVTLPQLRERRDSVRIPWREMAGVMVQRRVSKSTSGSYYSYLPTINRLDPALGVRRESLADWGWSEEKAGAFARWLSGQLKVEFKGTEDENPGSSV